MYSPEVIVASPQLTVFGFSPISVLFTIPAGILIPFFGSPIGTEERSKSTIKES